MTIPSDLALAVGGVVAIAAIVLACQLLLYFVLQYARPNIRFHKLRNDRTGDIVFLIRNFDAVRYQDTLRVTLEPVAVIEQVCVHAGPHCPAPPVLDPSGERIAIAFTKVPADATFSIRVRRKDLTRTVKIWLDPSSPLRPQRFDTKLPLENSFRRIAYFSLRFVVGVAGFVAVFNAGLQILGRELQHADWAFVAAGLPLALAVFVLVVPTGGKPTVAGYLGWSGASKDWPAEAASLARPRPVAPADPARSARPAVAPATRSPADVLIVLALAEEQNPFRQYLELQHHTAPMDYWTAVIPTKSGEQRSIALVVQKEMGGIEAAVLTSRAIALLRPRAVLMSGIMGGFKAQKVALGDIVIAHLSVDYAFGKIMTTDGAVGEEMQRRLSIQKLTAPLAASVQGWVTADQDPRGQSSFLATVKPQLLGVTTVADTFGSRIHYGPIASGPLVVASATFIANLQKTIDDKLLGVEMEIHGVMHAGHAAGLPVIGIKAVSDLADADKNAPSGAEGSAARAFAAHASAQLCVQLIRDEVIP